MSDKHLIEFRQRLYPAFSRRATQVCILSAALEKIAAGAADAPTVARAALNEANPFGWRERSGHMCGMQGFNGMTDECPACAANRRTAGVARLEDQAYGDHTPMVTGKGGGVEGK